VGRGRGRPGHHGLSGQPRGGQDPPDGRRRHPGEALGEIAPVEARIREELGDIVYGTDDETLEAVVGRLLRERGLTLATAESVTGGLLGGRITGIAGSSDYYLGGVVAYATDAKAAQLGVDQRLLDADGPVSEPVAAAMASGARTAFGADLGLAVTGVAGPAEQSGRRVGTICLGVADAAGTATRTHHRPRRPHPGPPLDLRGRPRPGPPPPRRPDMSRAGRSGRGSGDPTVADPDLLAGRLFFGVPIPGPARAPLEAALPRLDPLLPGARLTPPGGWHLTLAFLGQVQPEMADEVVRVGEAAVAGVGPARLRLEGAGTFPEGRRARVLWAGIGDDAEVLVRLAAALSSAAEAAGCARRTGRLPPT
jgi:2'-5' RNA ligase